MSKSSEVRAARYHATGVPPEVVQIDRVPVAAPGAGQVRVRMLCAPVNPSDLNMLEGKYGEARPLPDVPGNEGAGRVVAVGEGVDAALAGRLVLVDRGAWREEGVWDADGLIVVPEGIGPRHACVLRVNPPTAWRMLHDFVSLQAGDWVAQNAATSAVGRAAIEIAKAQGWKTLNFVRQAASAAELEALGADAVVVDDPDMGGAIPAGIRPKLGLNAVGGASATRLAGLLAPGAPLVTYGAMSREALKVPNGFLIFRDIVFRGFWLTRWLREHDGGGRAGMFAEIFRLAAAGCFQPRVAAEFPLDRVRDAVAMAASGQARGKVILQLAAE